MSLSVPKGFRLTGVHCGIKGNPNKQDITLVLADKATVAAGVYTQNLVHAAPVALDRQRTPANNIRAVVVNSGNANACTGDRGMQDALEMTRLTAAACGTKPEEVLVMSTGIIGEHLPMGKISAGISAAASQLGADEDSFVLAARGIMTTDKSHKAAARTLELDGRTITIAGMTKGAGMIGPKMATLLALVLTDAPLEVSVAQKLLAEVADETFNCISVEGHMSTNDTMLLLASGAAGGAPLAGESLATFRAALVELCTEIACMIPADGEGSTHLVTIDVSGTATREEARQIAQTIANSALVKTAITGGDPNWGRIVSAAGYSGIDFVPSQVNLHVNGHLLYQHGTPVKFDAKTVSQAMKDQHETLVQLEVGSGPGKCRFWTSDLTVEYVRFNADYRT